MGYSGTYTPPVIQRNVLENPSWYTAYTPYQAEISQGRLEALLVFQTVVQELTGFDIANASLLDEGTAAAEAMSMSHRAVRGKRTRFLVSDRCHPQTIAVLRTRAEPVGIDLEISDHRSWELDKSVFGVLLQYPATDGAVLDYSSVCEAAREVGAMVTMASDLLALCLLRPPAELGADIAIGSSQRFGVPMGFGGPHAAFIATRTKLQRQLPGRIIGVSRDAHGRPALRMALQTREQHIRRQKATSNICTAQVLLAVVAGLYAVWHGPSGLRRIAGRVHEAARQVAAGLASAGWTLGGAPFFDTVRVETGDRTDEVMAAALARGINLRRLDGAVCIALDETVSEVDLVDVCAAFGAAPVQVAAEVHPFARSGEWLTQPVFHDYRSETEMLRWLHRLARRDLALDTAMIPLGSCTMKLNATAEMIPISWAGFNGLHPFVPIDQAQGYAQMVGELEAWLANITGFAAVSVQPNAGSQGEYSGLLAIRAYHRASGSARNVCLVPLSAHGTNPASAVMAGMKVVTVACDDQGNIDVEDLKSRVEANQGAIAALMVTYPSTHGVFEEAIVEICEIIHAAGGLVYMDGANMNAMVGLARPGDIGADVVHLNLHKTFCIPHGGGGPGVGPIGVTEALVPFLPGHPLEPVPVDAVGAVAAAPWGSASILPITWAYIAMCGASGLRYATQVAILNANYIAKRLEQSFDVLYAGEKGRVAHECILDLRPFKAVGVKVDDVAKRLIDYGFHAPTMSFPVVGTLMVEPTESESLSEIDRFCDAMLSIRQEIQELEDGASDSPLFHAPHTAIELADERWEHTYSRTKAVFPSEWTLRNKYWPPVSRVDNAFGDRNLICSCDAWPSDAN
jgi:glycine dehydrogenase